MGQENLQPFHEYQGAYSVLLTDYAPTADLPREATLRGQVVFVTHGRIQQVMGGIQFYAYEKPFSWGYAFIKEIRDAGGKVLWRNWNYQSAT